MHDNKFEREVQGKMNALRMEPPAPVWAAVEARIGKERRKRRLLVFWLLLPLGLLLGSAGWWLLRDVSGNSSYAVRGKGHEPGQLTTSSTPLAGTKETSQQVSVAEAQRQRDTVAGNELPMKTADINNGPISETEQALSKTKEPVQLFVQKGSRMTASASPARRKKVAQATQGSIVPANHPEEIAASPGTPLRETTAPSAAAATSTSTTRKTAPVGPDSCIRATALATASKDAQLHSSNPTAAAPKPHRRRLQWALEGSAGVVMPISTSGFNADTLTGVVGSSSASTYSKQQWRSGPLYTIGGRLLLPLRGRLHLQAGLDIGLLQVTAETTTSYSAANPSTPFAPPAADESKTSKRVRSVLLQIPVTLEGRPSARLPLSLWGGASFSTLFGNTDPYGLPRTYVSLQAGARYRVARVGSSSLELGPQLWYGLKRLNGSQRPVGASAVLRLSF
ncbi:hypothetical protein [Flaviaesturariibacter terrae]